MTQTTKLFPLPAVSGQGVAAISPHEARRNESGCLSPLSDGELKYSRFYFKSRLQKFKAGFCGFRALFRLRDREKFWQKVIKVGVVFWRWSAELKRSKAEAQFGEKASEGHVSKMSWAEIAAVKE